MVKPIERILHSGLFGPWDRPDIKGVAADELPPAINPHANPSGARTLSSSFRTSRC